MMICDYWKLFAVQILLEVLDEPHYSQQFYINNTVSVFSVV